MARWQGAIGPTVQFNRSGTPIQIPGLVVSDNWDAGPILLIFTAPFRLSATPPDTARFFPFVDGASLGSTYEMRHLMASVGYYAFPLLWVLRLTAGFHTLGIGAGTVSGTGTFTIDDNAGRITAIQLPLWEAVGEIPS